MASHDWRLEMENMLSAFSRQAINSLGLIKLAFVQSGLSFTPEFKQYFLQASNHRINEAYDQFQVSSMFELQLSPSLNSVVNVSNISAGNHANGVECETNDRENGTSIGGESDWKTNASNPVIQIDDSGYGEAVINAVQTKSTDDDKFAVNNGAPSSEDRNETKSDMIVTQKTSETNGFNDGDFDFTVKTDDSDDTIEMAGIQSDSIDAGDDELPKAKVVLNGLDKATIAGLIKGKNKAMQLKQENSHKKRMMKMKETNDPEHVAIKSERSSSKQVASRNQNRCTDCGYVTIHKGHFNQHMRIHTGEKPYGCERCGKRFTNAGVLMKHAATHIAEFPFHCRACFQGFSLKTEMVAHENYCQKRHFECYLCKKLITFDKAELAKHMRIHSGDKPFRCEFCMMRFSRKDHLKRHSNNIHA